MNAQLPNFLAADSADPDQVMDEALETVRDHLGMDVSYMAELVGETVHFRRVSDPDHLGLIDLTATRPLADLYCGYMMAGQLPRLMPHVGEIPLARDLPITRDLGVQSHVSVPLYRTNGQFYGTFCCLSQKPNPSLNARDLNVVTMFANLTAKSLNAKLDAAGTGERIARAITDVIENADVEIHWQPIVDMATQQIRGMEALSRFAPQPYQSPDRWFAQAALVGMQQTLEMFTLKAAIAQVPLLPPDLYVSLNAAPETIAQGQLPALLAGVDPRRVVIEITEHDAIADHAALMRALAALRAMGVRLAIDDVGAGYAGLSTVLRLAPDILKLDRSLVDTIDQDPARQSLATAMVHFAREIGATMIAEGIERAEERAMLHRLGITLGQGYLFARPAPATHFSR